MSQFDFPRINFHGKVILDVATANNGYYQPMFLYNENESEAYTPPRIYFFENDSTYKAAQANNIPITPVTKQPAQYDPSNPYQYYAAITSVTDSNYQEWATTPLGTSSIDTAFHPLYPATNAGSGGTLENKVVGYWNFYGDLSMKPKDVKVTGVSIPNTQATTGVDNYNSNNAASCPYSLGSIIGSNLDFLSVMVDLDSIGQNATQIFYGNTSVKDSNDTTWFEGKPVKGSVKWMSLNRVINTSAITPTGGSATFISKIDTSQGSINPTLSSAIQQITGKTPAGLFMKLNIHEIYEIRFPNYSLLPGNGGNIPNNPCEISITGSICPYFDGDMESTTISRLLTPLVSQFKLESLSTWTSYKNNITQLTKGPSGDEVAVNTTVSLASVPFLHDTKQDVISLDCINALPEYGIISGTPVFPSTSYGEDPAPFTSFENCDLGTISLCFTPDGGTETTIGTCSFSDYNHLSFIQKGGVLDFKVSAGADYSGGTFSLKVDASSTNTQAMSECEVWLTSDEACVYIDEGDISGQYMNNFGTIKSVCTYRVFERGAPANEAKTFYRQDLLGKTPELTLQITDGQSINYQTDSNYNNMDAGCYSYGFTSDSNINGAFNTPQMFVYFQATTFMSDRVLDNMPYTNVPSPLTWAFVFNNVLAEYKTLLPIMDLLVPINEATWSSPILMQRLLPLIDLSNWDQPLYMPVTRELTVPQRKLLTDWANQIINQ